MVVALAAMAATALVQAMVTDGWEGIRRRVARLFGRGKPDVAIERRLDATKDQLTAAQPGELQEVQGRLARQWETRFADFLADYPNAAGELGELVKEMQASTATASDHAFAARDVDMQADNGGVNVNAGSFKGSINTGPTRPGPASS
jgi:hypothetical protein